MDLLHRRGQQRTIWSFSLCLEPVTHLFLQFESNPCNCANTQEPKISIQRYSLYPKIVRGSDILDSSVQVYTKENAIEAVCEN